MNSAENTENLYLRPQEWMVGRCSLRITMKRAHILSSCHDLSLHAAVGVACRAGCGRVPYPSFIPDVTSDSGRVPSSVAWVYPREPTSLITLFEEAESEDSESINRERAKPCRVCGCNRACRRREAETETFLSVSPPVIPASCAVVCEPCRRDGGG